MGNKLARTTQASPSEYYLGDLPSSEFNLGFKQVLGSDRFFKAILCRHDEGPLFVKIYFKRGDLDLREHARKLHEIREKFKNIENSHVLPFPRWHETDKAAYLFRQYFFSNLHDRISTRPFLSMIEKKWLTFQLLHAVKQSHERGVCHGDIKCENVLVTSWNWIYLADFASFKPTYIPDDNPADFSFFFDSGGRRRCYLAPERLYDPKTESAGSADAPLKPSMDMFSLGCVIAELFLEGQALFDLAQLLQYRKGQYDPKPSLEKISDTGIRSMILQMIHINPESRLSADDYLQTWAYDVFPTYFSPALHSLFSCLTVLESDARVTVIHNAFPEIRKQMIRDAKIKVEIDKGAEALPPSVPSQKTPQRNPRYKEDLVTDIDLLLKEEGTHHTKHEEQPDKPSLGFSYRLKAAAVKMAEGASMYEVVTEEIYENSLRELNGSFGEVFYTPDCLDNYTKFTYKEECMLPSQGGWTWEGDWEVNYKWSPVDTEGWRYCKCKNFDADAALPSTWTSVCTSDSLWKQRKWTRKRRKSYCQLLLPNKSTNKTIPATSDYRCEGMVLVASVLCSCLRNVKHPFTRREGVQLLHECAMLCDDDTRLQLVVPYVVAMLQDSAAIVRCTALQTLTNVLAAVRSFPPSDSKVFPEYIFPLLSMVPDDNEESVRICYADSIHKIASTAYRFLCSSTPSDVVQKLRINNKLEAEAAHLRETIARILHDLVMTPTIRRALLQHIASLCEFFGKQCNDFLLPILPAFLNDRDKQLRAMFFEQIVHVCIFVGEVSTEAYILPYLEQALSNVEETSIVNALECIATLCVHRLLKKRVLLKTVERASPLLCHPSRWVRRAAITLVAASGSTLSTADAYAYLVPMLQPFLRREPVSVSSEAALLACLKPPVPREVFQKVLSDVMDTIEKPKHNVTDGRVIHMGKIPRYKQPPQPGEAEDGEKLKAMEGYLRNLSSTMHTWESENPEKMESSNYDVSTDFPLYSRPVTEKKMESSSVEEWSRIRPLDALTYSQWASPDSNADILQKSVITFPSKLATSSVYGVRRDSFAGSTMVSNVTRVPHSSCESFNKFLNTVVASSVDWRPQGTLVAHLQEHQRAVNQIAVSADNTFFASASNDGLVKVWDCRRLERDTSFKSKLTYSLNERVLSLTTLNPDHQIAAASSSGQIHVFCVNYATRDSSTPERYSGISNVRKTDPQEGAVVTLQSLYAEENVPMLLYSTQRCGIHLWDFRKQADAMASQAIAKVEQGYITAMEVDPTHNWLVSGTSRGVLTLWDLRFHVPVHSWQLPGFHPVEAMCVPRHSSLPRPFVYVAAGREEVAVWNLENGTCQQVLRTNAHEGGTVPAALPHWSKTFSMKKQQEPSKHPDYRLDELNDPPPRLPGTRALLPSGVSVLTGGTDCRIRLWDHLRPENDYCVCGPTIATVGDQVKKDKPEQMKYKVKKLSGVHVTQELMPTAGPIREVSVAATDTAGCHRDTITSLAMAEPNNQQLLISSSRDGVIKVWK